MIPQPILLNCWKHHLGFIKSRIAEIQPGFSESFQSVIKELLSIGESQMDLYTGSLSPEKIAGEIIAYLSGLNVLSQSGYQQWLKENTRNFRTMNISDESTWVLLLGDKEERYVHIHPGRYSKNSVRIKANTLKTAVALLSWMKINDIDEADIQQINLVRKSYISLSPVKSAQSCQGLDLILSFLK